MYMVISHNYCIAMWENSIHTSGNDVQGNLSQLRYSNAHVGEHYPIIVYT